MLVGSSGWEYAVPFVTIALLSTTLPGRRDVDEESVSEPAPLAPELLHCLSGSAPVVAGLDTTRVNGLPTDVQYARFLPDRRGVILADRTDPFPRVFDRTGRLITTALPRGDATVHRRMKRYGMEWPK